MPELHKVILMLVLLFLSMGLIGYYSNWQTALGVFLFGWMLGVEASMRE